jgi:hypothetical protein
MSKDVKQIRIGHKSSPVKRAITWILGLAVCGGGGYAAYRYLGTPAKVEVAVARVRKADFIVSVQTRGDVRSVHSEIRNRGRIRRRAAGTESSRKRDQRPHG